MDFKDALEVYNAIVNNLQEAQALYARAEVRQAGAERTIDAPSFSRLQAEARRLML